MSDKPSSKPTASFLTGAIALIFMAIGYQTALLVHRAATLRIVAGKDAPDTVYVIDPAVAERLLPDSRPSPGGAVTVRRNAPHEAAAQQVRSRHTPRSFESFRFNPNSVSIEDLIRLGFSPRQAEAIDNYRRKGGRYARKEDFARSFVVADSVYERLEPFIDIPKTDLNRADSTAFDALPGIGPYYAAKMVAHRKALRGYSYPEQLLDLYRFDEERLNGLRDLVSVGPSDPYPLWTLPEDSLACHPYIGKHAAHGIVLFRDNNPPRAWSVEALAKAGILPPGDAARLGRCRLAPPPEAP